MKGPTANGTGFRLGDLIACLVVAVLLLGLLICGVRRAHAADEDKRCLNNLRQLGLAVNNYASTYNLLLPSIYSAPRIKTYTNPQSIFLALLPELEGDFLFKAAFLGENGKPAFDPENKDVNLTWMNTLDGKKIYASGFVKPLVCPAGPTNSPTRPTKIGWVGCSYGANYTVFGPFRWQSLYTFATIPDGTSATIFFAERFAQYPGELGQYTGPDGKQHQANTLWAWPADYRANPPTAFTKPVTQNVAMFAYGKPNKKVVGHGPVVFSQPQLDVTPDKADYRLVQSGHPKVVHVGMGDGSARGVSGKVSQETWQRAITPNDGHFIGDDW
jgi:hypothetical protein